MSYCWRTGRKRRTREHQTQQKQQTSVKRHEVKKRGWKLVIKSWNISCVACGMAEGRFGENIGSQHRENKIRNSQATPSSTALGQSPSAFSLLPFSFFLCVRSLPSLGTLALAILSVGCCYTASYYTSPITLPHTPSHGKLAYVRWGIIHLCLHPRFFLDVSVSQSRFHHISTLNATAFCVMLFPVTHFPLLYASWNISSYLCYSVKSFVRISFTLRWRHTCSSLLGPCCPLIANSYCVHFYVTFLIYLELIFDIS